MTLNCQAAECWVINRSNNRQGNKARKSFVPLLQEPMATFEDVLVASTSSIMNGCDIWAQSICHIFCVLSRCIHGPGHAKGYCHIQRKLERNEWGKTEAGSKTALDSNGQIVY